MTGFKSAQYIDRPAYGIQGKNMNVKLPPGSVRDAIFETLSRSASPVKIQDIEMEVGRILGPTPPSSIRSYLRINTPKTFIRVNRGVYALRQQWECEKPRLQGAASSMFRYGKSELYNEDCFDWLKAQPPNSIHAVVTDPPYGLVEYSKEEQAKLKRGKGGVWRIPPSFDGHTRSPLPRFTTLTSDQLDELRSFFRFFGHVLSPVLTPGAHVLVASNPLLSYILSSALAEAGLERRGEIIRLTMTMRGGDRPKGAHNEFPEVSVMPRSMWEPWVIFRKPLEGRVQDNLKRWKTGAFRRPSKDHPFCDVIKSSPTRGIERKIAPHPSLKPQTFLRKVVRAVLPLGEGVILDPFAGSGSTLSAAEAIGYRSIGVEKDSGYFLMARKAIPDLAKYQVADDL
ncbi:MAG: site-specific DNA-methyltransferase [Candidatus Accumulibacter sp.]|jgi:site-specific DNA-methyltransferase (adenine-specific)|nr:site-specific DNA-methyltransferase [Accumulibacter sp.]